MSGSGKEAKLKRKERKKFYSFMFLSCRLGHRQTSTLQEFHTVIATHNCGISSKSRVHPLDYVPCIPPYKLPPSIHIIHGPWNPFSTNSDSLNQSTSSAVYQLSNYPQTRTYTTLLAILLNQWRILSSTPFATLSILLILNKPLVLSICTTLILNLFILSHCHTYDRHKQSLL